MNSKKAKALRRIARELALPEENSYEPVGPIRRREAIVDHGRSYTAGIVRRPFALKACERRAYLEAKALYKGGHAEVIQPQVAPTEPVRPFKDAVIDSVKRQAPGPVLK